MDQQSRQSRLAAASTMIRRHRSMGRVRSPPRASDGDVPPALADAAAEKFAGAIAACGQHVHALERLVSLQQEKAAWSATVQAQLRIELARKEQDFADAELQHRRQVQQLGSEQLGRERRVALLVDTLAELHRHLQPVPRFQPLLKRCAVANPHACVSFPCAQSLTQNRLDVATKIKAHRATTTSPVRVKRLGSHYQESTKGPTAAIQQSTHTPKLGARANEISTSPTDSAGPTEAFASSWQELISPSCNRSEPDGSLRLASAWSEKSECSAAILAESIDEYEDRVGRVKALEQDFLDSQASRIKVLEQDFLDSQAEIRRLEAQVQEERNAFDCLGTFLANNFLEMEKLQTGKDDSHKITSERSKDQTREQTALTPGEAGTTRWSRIFSKIMLALERSEILSRLSWAEHRSLLSIDGGLESCNVVKRLKGERIFKQVSLHVSLLLFYPSLLAPSPQLPAPNLLPLPPPPSA